jgi:hypothetical protein
MYTGKHVDKLRVVGFSLLFSVLACQPVIAIGWREGMFIFLLIALLIGPPVYRFFRRLENSRRHKEK